MIGFLLLFHVSFVLNDVTSKHTVPVISLTEENIEDILKKNDAVLLNFHAPWCHYSLQFMPIFESVGAELQAKYNSGPTVIAGAVNGNVEQSLENKYGIRKYPTVKLCIQGRVLHEEFRGARSRESLVKFVEEHLRDPSVVLQTDEDWSRLFSRVPVIIAHVKRPNKEVHETFKTVAKWLRSVCNLYVTYQAFHLPSSSDANQDHIFFKEEDQDFSGAIEFSGNSTNPAELFEWVRERCRKTVPELTFQNAEELTEAGVPLLVLFQENSDNKSLELFRTAVKRDLADQLHRTVRALVADGNVFLHPLHQVGKTSKDLPLIILDSFVHSYLFKSFADLEVPGKLKEFVKDLESGKLHVNYHVDELRTAISQASINVKLNMTDYRNDNDKLEYFDYDYDYGSKGNSGNNQGEKNSTLSEVQDRLDVDKNERSGDKKVKSIVIAESSFKSLKPSKYRYTFKRDEL